MLYIKNPNKLLKHTIVIPFVSVVIIPMLFMDLWMEIYHRICFPLCGIPYVNRSDYIRIFDRAKLQYLNPVQKMYCMYCGYGNGVMSYWVKIANETEHYWCGIQHKKVDNFAIPEYQKNFSKYDDEQDFKK